MEQDGNRPSVSVVIPTRGRPDFLQQALASVQAQDFDGLIETIVVFDHSDADASLAESSTPTRPVQVAVNTRTPGPAGARNTGIQAASHDLIAFLDDDDVWAVEKIRRQVDEMQRSGRRAVATTILVDDGGQVSERSLGSSILQFSDLLRSRTQTVHQSTVVVERMYLVNEVGLFDEQIPSSYGEDFDWLLRATSIEPIQIVLAPLTRVRWHSTSWFYDRWHIIVAALLYLTEKHPLLWSDRRGSAVLMGRLAFAHAAMGERRKALRWIARTFRTDPLQPRWMLALPVVASARAALPVLRVVRRASGRSV
ncbi:MULTISPECIES: glycosyltransferase family 2 protein [unclassified Modestobacter]